jgi:Putative Actinobacterial Holin-X, holin superfamily III
MSSEELREQSIGDLLKHLSEQTATLVRQDLELAKAEMQQKGKRAGVGIGLIGGGGVLALAAVGALTATLILLLGEWMDAWIAALIVTVVYAAAAALLALRGKEKVSEATPPIPEETIETVKEDVQWAKTQISSGSK